MEKQEKESSIRNLDLLDEQWKRKMKRDRELELKKRKPSIDTKSQDEIRPWGSRKRSRTLKYRRAEDNWGEEDAETGPEEWLSTPQTPEKAVNPISIRKSVKDTSMTDYYEIKKIPKIKITPPSPLPTPEKTTPLLPSPPPPSIHPHSLTPLTRAKQNHQRYQTGS